MPSFDFVAANSDNILSGISSTPFPGKWPIVLGGWCRFDDLTTNDSQPAGIGQGQSGTTGNRIQLSTDVSDGDFDFVQKNAAAIPATITISIPFPAGLKTSDWIFYCIHVVGDTNRICYLGHNQRLYTATNTADTIQYSAFDNFAFGFLPFFGGVNHHDGPLGTWFGLADDITKAEIYELLAGADVSSLQRRYIDVFDLDGRGVSPFRSRFGKFRLTNNGADYSTEEPQFPPYRSRLFEIARKIGTVGAATVFNQAVNLSLSMAPAVTKTTFVGLERLISLVTTATTETATTVLVALNLILGPSVTKTVIKQVNQGFGLVATLTKTTIKQIVQKIVIIPTTAVVRTVLVLISIAMKSGVTRTTFKGVSVGLGFIGSLIQPIFNAVIKLVVTLTTETFEAERPSAFSGHGGLGMRDGRTRWKLRTSKWRRRR